MYGWRALWKTRKRRSTRTSTLDGCTKSRVVGVEDDPPRLDLGPDRAIAEHHLGVQSMPGSRRSRALCACEGGLFGQGLKPEQLWPIQEGMSFHGQAASQSEDDNPAKSAEVDPLSIAASRPRPTRRASELHVCASCGLGSRVSDRLGAGRRTQLVRGPALPRVRVDRRRHLQPGGRRPLRRSSSTAAPTSLHRGSGQPHTREHGGRDPSASSPRCTRTTSSPKTSDCET